jgi:UDP-GlcNAc:undecaprenyl-phosphate GlcNAc-1-phosphate transferase
LLSDLGIPGALALSLVAALLLTPGAIRAAKRLNFYDHPSDVQYKRQLSPTPYLGGIAVVAGLVVAAVSFGTGAAEYLPLVVGAVAFWAIGTVDDRIAVRPRYRIGAEVAAGAVLWAIGLGWSVFDNPVLDLALTAFWVVGVVNAVNILDNMDGVAAAVGSVCGAGVAVVALADGDLAVAALAAALGGACLGFLPYNITSPARIYLGDGGTMPLGFSLAALIMAVTADDHLHLAAPLAGALLAGVPILNTTLVTVSRRREM